MKPSDTASVDRRGFLKGVAAAAMAATPAVSAAAPQAAQPAPSQAAQPEPQVSATGTAGAGPKKYASDFMVDLFRSMNMEYMFAMCASSFIGIHESVINYAGNRNPESITCTHEEISVAMANGYAKIEGKPVLVCVHGTVGTQHAAMAVYDAWCDRVPIFLVLGNTQDATERAGEVFWVHSAQDPAAILRDMTKWDDNPVSLAHFVESAARAYAIAMTPPMGPVAIVVDDHMQDGEAPPHLRLPKVNVRTPPSGDAGAVREAAKLLVAADNPVIVASRCARTPAGMTLLVELAESLQAGVVDQHRRMNFPTRHPLNGGATNQADVVLALEGGDISNLSRQAGPRNAKVISITAADLFQRSNYGDYMRYAEVDLAIAADAEATLPALIEEVKRLTTGDRKRAFAARGAKIAAANRETYERAKTEATYGWDASPISTARLSMELWQQIRNEDWSLVTGWVNWPLRLCDFTKHYQYIGRAGGEGVGYYAQAAVGAALANRKPGRFTVAIAPDGELMVERGSLWTGAPQDPLLIVMQNNRAYHQEVMWFQRRRCCAIESRRALYRFRPARSEHRLRGDGEEHGRRRIGPDLRSGSGGSHRRGVGVVKRGEPYLIDVVTQPR